MEASITESEKRLHRYCFTGHRPEKLHADEASVKQWREARFEEAIQDGYVTFITGMVMGVDLWAGKIVLQKRAANTQLHLVAATPWPGFSARWSPAIVAVKHVQHTSLECTSVRARSPAARC